MPTKRTKGTAPPKRRGGKKGGGRRKNGDYLRRIRDAEQLMIASASDKDAIHALIERHNVSYETACRWVRTVLQAWEAESSRNTRKRERLRQRCTATLEMLKTLALKQTKVIRVYDAASGKHITKTVPAPEINTARRCVESIAKINGLYSVEVQVGAADSLIGLMRAASNLPGDPEVIDLVSEIPEPLPLASGDG